MNIESLKTFITLAELGNFTKTAQQHYIVQSTVTARIKELEQEVGEKLFVRTPGNIRMTEAGRKLLPYAKKMVDLQRLAINEVGSKTTYLDVLRIGTAFSICDGVLRQSLLEFIKQNDDIAIKVMVGHSRKLLQQLHDDVIDICLTYVAFESMQFLCVPFHCDELVLVTNPNNPIFPQGISNDEIRSLALLHSDFVISEGRSWLESILSEHRVFSLQIDIGSQLIPFLEDGFGYCFLPRSIVQESLDKGSLVEIDLREATSPKLQSYLIVKKKSLQNEAVMRWIEQDPALCEVLRAALDYTPQG